MVTTENLLLVVIAIGIGIGVQLARIAANLASVARIASELAPVAEELPKLVKMRKPMRDFMAKATEGFSVPLKIVELTKDHLEQITSLASGAVMAYDMMKADEKRRAENPPQGPLPAGTPLTSIGLVPLPNPPANGGTVAVKQTEKPAEKPAETKAPKLNAVLGEGANGGKVERIVGRVDMGASGAPLKSPSGDPPRDIALGAVSGADGTT